MTLKIEDPETEKLATEVAEMTGASETEVVREALRERRDRIHPTPRRQRTPGEIQRWLETEVWPLVPAVERGRPPMTKAEKAQALGYGPEEY